MKSQKDTKEPVFTSVRREPKTGEMKLRHLSAEAMLSLISRENKRMPFTKFRENLPTYQSLGGRMEFTAQRIYVPASFEKDGDGKRYERYNGLVLLNVGGLASMEEAEWVKRLAQMQPSTYAAFVGSTGRSCKLLVKVSGTDGALPQSEREAQEFHRIAYYLAYSTYNGTLNFPITRVDPTLEQSFVRTYDPKPYINEVAVPLKLDKGVQLQLEENKPAVTQPLERIEPGLDGYLEFERRFIALSMKVLAKEGSFTLYKTNPERFFTLLAKECCLTGLPQEEAICHTRNHFPETEEERIRLIFEGSYQLTTASFGTHEALNHTQSNALKLRQYMKERYVLRHNVIQDTTEYRLNNTWDTQFRLLDDRMMGKMVEEARLRGINVWDKDVRRYVNSADVENFNPVEAFLNSVRGTWDGRDRIRELADTVKTKNPHWREWFYRWLLSMTAQWLGVMGPYGNSVAPILIGRQGFRKSTFCRNLLPDELQFGYTDQLDFSSKKEIDRTICQFLLVNLDEFDQLNRHNQDGYLKNLLQRADIRTRKPYKTQVSQMRRYASFIGTSNQSDLLTDPTGSRRYLCIELTAPIDTDSRPNYRQLYAQALQAIESGERYWFDDHDVEQIMESNREFMHLDTSEMLFHDYFCPAQEEEGAEWISASALLEELRHHAGSSTSMSAVSFGRYLRHLPGMRQKRTAQANFYLIKRLK
ncbi:MAG: DUF3874 domain-containing protein [Bacteroidaceae bacterium]|nr:DUF3874 domain-containing protein [Bacteroidaceae bacterium]MBQ9883177.1 DUF3874 domain-containing protein [Bacteroidaceae bacterium]